MDWATHFGDEDDLRWGETFLGSVNVDRDNRLVTANGDCPRCGHATHFSLSDKKLLASTRSVATKGPTEVSDSTDVWDGPIRFRVWCTCEGEHDGRPADTSAGCGWNHVYRDDP